MLNFTRCHLQKINKYINNWYKSHIFLYNTFYLKKNSYIYNVIGYKSKFIQNIFLSFYFLTQLNKENLYCIKFSSSQPNTGGKNIKSFLFFHFLLSQHFSCSHYGGLSSRKYYWNCMYWAYDPMAQSEDGPLKIIIWKKSEEGIKIVYKGPKYVRGGESPRRYRTEVTWVFLSSWTFFKIAS